MGPLRRAAIKLARVRQSRAICWRLASRARRKIASEAGQDFYLHRNSNNLAVLPKTLNKARAVHHLRQQLQAEHGEIMTLGMGDSQSDARFMAACDYAIVPSGTQLAALTVAAL